MTWGKIALIMTYIDGWSAVIYKNKIIKQETC